MQTSGWGRVGSDSVTDLSATAARAATFMARALARAGLGAEHPATAEAWCLVCVAQWCLVGAAAEKLQVGVPKHATAPEALVLNIIALVDATMVSVSLCLSCSLSRSRSPRLRCAMA